VYEIDNLADLGSCKPVDLIDSIVLTPGPEVPPERFASFTLAFF